MSSRLSELTRAFRLVSVGQPLVLKGPLGQPQFPRVESSVWETAVSGGAASHMPLDLRLRYSRSYAGIFWFRDKTDEESDAWSHLSQFDDQDVMTEQDWSALHQWKARAQSVGAKVDANISDGVVHDMAKALGVEPRPFRFKPASAAARKALCRPMI